ncbi:MAG: S41 family peptidase, partial [Leptospiraceae bacterium]|nr:S41 family peptidase [Leptospiraceae bacterium]
MIFIPDYGKWNEKLKELNKIEKERREALTAQQRVEEARRLREKEQEIQRFEEESWKKISFNDKDFEKVLGWIESNYQSYNHLHEDYKGQDPYKDHPFGMEYVYFAATNGFLQNIDPHSSIIDRSSWARMRAEAEDSTFEGIGALLRGGGPREVVVETPLPGSPALRSGLRAGDIIRKVDTVDITNLPLSDVVQLIRGPRETIVKLEVERTTELRNLEIPITRDVIVQTAVSSRLIDASKVGDNLVGNNKIGVIKIQSFLYMENNTSGAVMEEYEKLLKEAGGRLDGLVLDLRGNPGGFLNEAVEVADLFLPPGRVVVQVRGAGEYKVEKTERSVQIQGLPIVVLIDAGSASASEIVASALMDHNAALVLGERSFGKATVQGITTQGSVVIKLTTARYYAPRGYTIQVYGVEPDIAVSDELEGTFPPRWREEDMWKHLPELKKREVDTHRKAWADSVAAAVGDNQAAEDYIKAHANDALKTDFMLIRSLAYVRAMQT